ncbi:unnamed protein product, partial [Polarella glacialis]
AAGHDVGGVSLGSAGTRPRTAPGGAATGSMTPLERESQISYGGGSPVLRKKLFDQNVAEWGSRYQKNKKQLDTISRECQNLRSEAAKQQQELDGKIEHFDQMEARFNNEVMPKFGDAKSREEAARQERHHLQVDLSENRKLKVQLSRDRKILCADFERKHSELGRGAETRDRLEAQLGSFTLQRQQVTSERQRMERELDLVSHNLRRHTELADEAHHETERTCGGIKTSVHHMNPSIRLESSTLSHEAIAMEEKMAK